jgi:hypothetical protein
VEYVIELANDLYERDAAHDGEELEHEATDMCHLFYQLCLDVTQHVEGMGSGHTQLASANIHGIVLLESLAHKVAALHFVMKGVFYDLSWWCISAAVFESFLQSPVGLRIQVYVNTPV